MLIRQYDSDMAVVESTAGIDLLYGLDPNRCRVPFTLDRIEDAFLLCQYIDAKVYACLGTLRKIKSIGSEDVAGQILESISVHVVQILQCPLAAPVDIAVGNALVDLIAAEKQHQKPETQDRWNILCSIQKQNKTGKAARYKK